MIDKAAQLIKQSKNWLVLTGAGISADSGIPTFRGKEGYWKEGSKNYHPQDLARKQAFVQMPETVWNWYLYRREICNNADPNPSHYALVKLEDSLEQQGKGFTLVTQNVDGLHLRAGSRNVFQIHGNINTMRWLRCDNVEEIPEDFDPANCRCSKCQAQLRPQILWFDESYDEKNFYFSSTQSAADDMDWLVFIGTTLLTGLPSSIVDLAAWRNVPMIEINPQLTGTRGVTVGLDSNCVEVLPELIEKVILESFS